MIGWDELRDLTGRAQERLDSIAASYPELKMYLVLASENGQVGIDSSPLRMVQDFPAMIADHPYRSKAVALASTIQHLDECWRLAVRLPVRKLPHKASILEDLERRLARAHREVEPLLPRLGARKETRVEIRFRELRYRSIWKLQADARVDRRRTPHSKASIRVVLGLLGDFAADHSNHQKTVGTVGRVTSTIPK